MELEACAKMMGKIMLNFIKERKTKRSKTTLQMVSPNYARLLYSKLKVLKVDNSHNPGKGGLYNIQA